MILGDWMAPEPLQGVHLSPLAPGLWDLRAVGICSGLAPYAIPSPGVMAHESRAQVYTAIVQCSTSEIKQEASRLGGVAIRTQSEAWIIKGIALAMRQAASPL